MSTTSGKQIPMRRLFIIATVTLAGMAGGAVIGHETASSQTAHPAAQPNSSSLNRPAPASHPLPGWQVSTITCTDTIPSHCTGG